MHVLLDRNTCSIWYHTWVSQTGILNNSRKAGMRNISLTFSILHRLTGFLQYSIENFTWIAIISGIIIVKYSDLFLGKLEEDSKDFKLFDLVSG